MQEFEENGAHTLVRVAAGVVTTPIAVDEDLTATQIQGNILGFNKPCQAYLFLRFYPRWRSDVQFWLEQAVANVTSVHTVQQARRERSGGRHEKATWTNLAFTYSGLKALGTLPLDGLPEEFVAGMARRFNILGDRGKNAPANWVINTCGNQVHALLLLAADEKADLNTAVAEQIARFGRGVRLHFLQYCSDLPAGREKHDVEHFGFKDGMSQPDFKRGGIVVGYGERSTPPKAEWTVNGSYLVFRRLRQDVRGFWVSLGDKEAEADLDRVDLAAKLIGRRPDGSPLAGPVAPNGDFNYDADPQGDRVPLAAHIRKVNPRIAGQERPILRRGVPFGPHFNINRREPDGGPPFPFDRGLLFIGYQESIKHQFEFVQQRWANDHTFPDQDDPPGQDPIIGQGSGNRDFKLRNGGKGVLTLASWVTMTGGDYFFSPSIDALGELADQSRRGGKPMQHQLVDPQQLEQNSKRYGGGGSCGIQITFTATNLLDEVYDEDKKADLRELGIYWEIWEGTRRVWRSHSKADRLRVDGANVVTGRVEVTVAKLLRAVIDTYEAEGREITVKELYQRTLGESDDAQKLAKYFTVKAYLGDEFPVVLPIDMCVHGC